LSPCVRQIGAVAEKTASRDVDTPDADRRNTTLQRLYDMKVLAVEPNRGSVLERNAPTFSRLIVAKASSKSLSLSALTT